MKTALPLRAQQRWFSISSTHAGGIHEGSAVASRLLGYPSPLAHWVTDGPRLAAADRLAIYNEGYFARLIECLADDYPALQHLVGEEAFASLARAYIDELPSRSPSLNAYGREMARICRTRLEPWSAVAADLARLEWAIVEVIHAPSTPSLDAALLSKIPAERWQGLRLSPSPTLRLLAFDYPVNAYYQAFREGLEPGLPERSPSSTAVYRQGLPVARMDLEPTAALLLEDLLAGCPLDSAVAELERRSSAGADIVQKLPHWLGSWVASGFFCAVEY